MKRKQRIKRNHLLKVVEMLKSDIDFLVSLKNKKAKEDMAGNIIYTVIKLAVKDDYHLTSKILVETETAIINNLKYEADL